MDYQDILNRIVAALNRELGQGFSAISNYTNEQGRLLAKQASGIALSRASGSLANDDEQYHFFLANLKTNTENFVKSIVMLTALTIEKAWNAVAGILWGAIRTILQSAGVADNLLPETPPINL